MTRRPHISFNNDRYKNGSVEDSKLIYPCYFNDFTRPIEGRDLKEESKGEINANILNLIETRNLSPGQQKQGINAIKFYYEKALGGNKCYFAIDRPRKKFLLPNVLSKDEVKRMIDINRYRNPLDDMYNST